ncbi:MAG: MarC family protein [Ilumatobacter sp.]|jgi:multiple antibiotic resistance protein|nr:MarC family protein [Acidimicrobiia bacterium]NCW47897.1 MarC family protein [Actinomycetota bacterium]
MSDARLFTEVLVTMLVIMDPVGNVPIFLSVTRRLSPRSRNRAALVAVATAAAVIGAFAIIGRQVLDYLDVSVPALQGAGGLLLLLVALELLTGSESDEADALDPDDHVGVAMVPLGTPLLAGPGAIVATIVFVGRADGAGDRGLIALAVLGVLVAVYLAMRFSGLLIRVLRNSGILLLSRIAGLLLAAIAVQMLADAVIAFARQV